MEMIKSHQSSKPNISISNCEAWRNLTFASTPHMVLIAPSSIQQLREASTSKTTNSWYKPSQAMQALIYIISLYRYASTALSLIYEQTTATTQLPVVNDAMQPNAILCPVQCNTLSDLTQVQVPKHQTPVYVFFH
jgi:hypothetical protein